MAAFGAPEEPHLALIGRPQLAEPPERKIVLALGALDLDRGHRFYICIFIVDDGDLVLRAHFLTGHAFRGLDLPYIPTLPAFELAPRRD
jgi:predicted amidohydrolase